MPEAETKSRGFRFRWWVLALLVASALVGSLFFVQHSVTNVIHPALDQLSAISDSERWSHPEMLKIRALGEDAVPSLRRVLREKNNPAIRLLLWVRTKWPGATKYYSHFPDSQKMTERRLVACEVLRTLGPAGKAAAPELIEILKGKDPMDLRAAFGALYAIGVDASICEQLDALIEQGAPSVHILSALSRVKPPSTRTLMAITATLTDPSPYVQMLAAQTLGEFGISSPEIISSLKKLQATTTNNQVLVSTLAALWDLQKDTSSVSPRVFPILEQELTNLPKSTFPVSRSQAVADSERVVMMSGFLFQRMKLGEPDRAKALGLLESYCKKSGRISIRMQLLPPMMDLGFPPDKCLAVCRDGLSAEEVYLRTQAARLLTQLGEKYPLDGVDLDELLQDRDVGVRIYAAKAHWYKHHLADTVVPVLVESLDRSKYQSYYYTETQPVALSVLGEIGPEAKAAHGLLEKLLSDPNSAVVEMASDALTKIRE